MAIATCDMGTSSIPQFFDLVPWHWSLHEPLREDFSDPCHRHRAKLVCAAIGRFYELEMTQVQVSGSVFEIDDSSASIQVALMRTGDFWRGFRLSGFGLGGHVLVEASVADIADLIGRDLERIAAASWNLARNASWDSPCSVEIVVDANDRIVTEVFPL